MEMDLHAKMLMNVVMARINVLLMQGVPTPRVPISVYVILDILAMDLVAKIHHIK